MNHRTIQKYWSFDVSHERLKEKKENAFQTRKEQYQLMKNNGHLDHFIEEKGDIFAGKHIIIDLWGSENLDDIPLMKKVFEEAIRRCKATLLHLHLHHFTPNNGISAVAILAESHISVHTWPECSFAAFDVFMCGDAKPQKLIEVIQEFLSPEEIKIGTLQRGNLENFQDEP